MPLTKEDFLMHPEFGPMPQDMGTVAQVCCGFSKADCRGDCEVASSNLLSDEESHESKAELAARTGAENLLGGIYS